MTSAYYRVFLFLHKNNTWSFWSFISLRPLTIKTYKFLKQLKISKPKRILEIKHAYEGKPKTKNKKKNILRSHHGVFLETSALNMFFFYQHVFKF